MDYNTLSEDTPLSSEEIRKYEMMCNYIATIDLTIKDQIDDIKYQFTDEKYQSLLKNMGLLNAYKGEIRKLKGMKKKILKPMLKKYGLN